MLLLALGGCADETPTASREALTCPMPENRPAGMTVIVLSPGVMRKEQLRHVLLNPSNRQLTNVYDSRGNPLFQCRGEKLRVISDDPQSVLEKYAMRRGRPATPSPALTIATLQKVILPDILTSYREYLEHVRRGDVRGTLADPRWGQLDFRFVLARPLQQRDSYPVQEYSCEMAALHARRAEKVWRATLRELRVKGYMFGIRAVDVFIDTPVLPQAGLYALGVNIGMRTRGQHARFRLHDNPQCFLRAARDQKLLRLHWNNCVPLRSNLMPGSCPDAEKLGASPKGASAGSDPKRSEEAMEHVEPPEVFARSGPDNTRERKIPEPSRHRQAYPALSPAYDIPKSIIEMISVRVDDSVPAPSRASARLLSGRARIQLQLTAPDGTEIARSLAGDQHTVLKVKKNDKSSNGVLHIMISPDNRSCIRKDILAVEVRLEGPQGEFLGLARHFRRLKPSDCSGPVKVTLWEARG